MKHAITLFFLLAVPAALPLAAHAQATLRTPGYSTEQAVEGQAAYEAHCASCHGQELSDAEFGPALKGVVFSQLWGGKPMDELFVKMVTTMPVGAPRSLEDATYAAILAYILQHNGISAGAEALPANPQALAELLMPTEATYGPGALVGGITLPPAPERGPNPLDVITPVTADMLEQAPAGDWLTWRRTNDASGYSPLAQITTDNVADLRMAWSWGLPPGPDQTSPLVHDGVLFVHGQGDILQALDAVSGELLWEYRRWLPAGTSSFNKRSFAFYGHRLYLPTSDIHVVALDVKTGQPVWDTAIGDPAAGTRISGGPVIAKGKVLIGTGGRTPGGGYIVGLDADTGEEVWRFHTIPRPGEPGGDSWNGVPWEERTGGTVWGVGSYDADLGLAFFGTAPTYDTAPLAEPSDIPGTTREALYTNTTLALDPDTGKLAWFYQHMANDQWDMDWAYERHILTLPVDGRDTKVIATGGKLALYDLLEAATGRYLGSVDLGLQNIVTSIDPETGAKHTDDDLLPGPDRTVMICPNTAGGKNWHPGAYSPDTRLLYVPLMEICMDLVPVGPDARGLLSTGVSPVSRPRPGSDGKYGHLAAVNLETREIDWTYRQRAPLSNGVLTTAGGLVFVSDVDRYLAAHDAASGEKLWQVRLNDASNVAPITYLAGGRQYVAVTTGRSILAVDRRTVVPEITLPANPAPTLWVFELP